MIQDYYYSIRFYKGRAELWFGNVEAETPLSALAKAIDDMAKAGIKATYDSFTVVKLSESTRYEGKY